MRNLNYDLEWLTKGQNRRDLSDEYLAGINETTRESYKDDTFDFDYGISFVESWIAEDWLRRAIKAEQAFSARDKEWREKIEALQGEWVGVAETYCPDWVLDLRYILSEMEGE